MGFIPLMKRPYRTGKLWNAGNGSGECAKYYGAQQIGCDFEARGVMDPLTATKKAIHGGSKNFLNTILPVPLRIRV